MTTIQTGDHVTILDEGGTVYRAERITGDVVRLVDLDGNKYGLYDVAALARLTTPPGTGPARPARP